MGDAILPTAKSIVMDADSFKINGEEIIVAPEIHVEEHPDTVGPDGYVGPLYLVTVTIFADHFEATNLRAGTKLTREVF